MSARLVSLCASRPNRRLIRLDVVLNVMDTRYRALGDPKFPRSRFLERVSHAGDVNRKRLTYAAMWPLA